MRQTAFVQIGDTHLDDSPRQADCLAALDQIIEEGARLPELGAWLWPGDLFHARSTIATRNALAQRLCRMIALAPVIMDYGNHDVDGDLDVFALLAGKHRVHVVSSPRCVELTLANGQPATLFVLPYPHKAGLVARGVPQQELAQKAAEALDVLFMKAADELTAARRAGRLTAMIGHANVVGSLLHAGQPQIGPEISLDWTMLDRLGDCYKGLNHIHLAQEIGGATYAGSICRLSWGEIEPKSYVVITYAEDGTYSVDRRPVKVPPMWHMAATLTRDGFRDFQPINFPDPTLWVDGARRDWTGCDVRLRATYRQSEGVVLTDAAAQAKALFSQARRFEFEPVCVPDRAVRAPEVATAKTLTQKLEAWAKLTGTSLPESIAEKLGQLETLDSDALIAHVQAATADEAVLA